MLYQVGTEVYMTTKAGVRKTPMKLPTVVWTTVKAWLPCACRVMMTLLLIVVATQPKKFRPTRRAGSMKRLVAVALTKPKTIAEVTRKHCAWTKRWIFHLP